MPAPWFKFYPSDWQSEPSLRVCTLAARGLWIEMLCLMHKADPRGYLLLADQPITESQLAGLVGRPPAEVAKLVAELEAARVFSRDAAGVIFSRRMCRDERKAAEDKANGSKGGNPKIKRGVGSGVNPPPNHKVGSKDKAQKPDARALPSQVSAGGLDGEALGGGGARPLAPAWPGSLDDDAPFGRGLPC